MTGVSGTGTCVVCGCHDVEHVGTVSACPECGWDGAMDGHLDDGEAHLAYAVYDARPMRLTPFFDERAAAEMVKGRLSEVSDRDVYIRAAEKDGL